MGLTSALYTGLSGLNANQIRIDTIGNNIANVNTTAYKASRSLFQNQFSQTLSFGNPPSATSGGVNPTQIGLGTVLGSIQRSFTPGSIETTGIASDLSIEGNGFFVLRKGADQQVYTRDGAFSVNSDHKLVTQDGDVVQGFAADANSNIIPGVLTDLNINLGSLTLARATQSAGIDGDLSSIGTVGTQTSVNTSQALVNGGGGAADGGTALTDVRSAGSPGVPLFAAGTIVTVSRVTKGDRELPTQSFTVGADGNTLDDFANWLNGALGINTAAGLPGSPGATIENGTLVIRGNIGEQADIGITPNDFATDNAAAPLPFTFTKTAAANGSGVYTGFTVYDSLGNPLTVNLTFVMDSTPATGPVWRFYAESPDNGAERTIGTGTISFDTEGNFLSSTGTNLTIDRSASGSATPLSFEMDFSRLNGLASGSSNVVLADQDGYAPGTLDDFAVGQDGTVTGTFTNGLSRALGQVALASFANAEGLISTGDNLYLVGPGSGNPTIASPGESGTGGILGGALELSNVDLSREFIGLITSSTGFQAASRVISVSSDLLNQLLLIAR